MNTDNLRTYLALNRIPGLGPRRIARLERCLGDLSLCFTEKTRPLQSLGLPEPSIQALKQVDWGVVDKDLRWAEHPNHHILHWHAEHYPKLLKAIHAPPPILYVRGNLAKLSDRNFAIVGTRKPSSAGTYNAHTFSGALAKRGYCITSGLALGIDGVCHEAALAYPSSTVAVIATGVDITYPKRHHLLAEKIAAHGAIVSEFPLGTTPRDIHFPRRNRIISGLSLGVLVIEAAQKSGSLITVRHALEQGREVFALPGTLQNPMAAGCHALIKEGAALVETIDDILEALPEPYPPPFEKSIPKQQQPLANPMEQGVKWEEFETLSVDQVIERSGLPPNVVLAHLTELEIRGTIRCVPGGYMKVRHE